MGSDAPSCIADMKLILGGKFLDNSESLDGMSRCPPSTSPTGGSTITFGVSCKSAGSGSDRRSADHRLCRADLRATLGDPGEVPVMTMHAVIRPVSAGKNPGVHFWDSCCAEF